jgi:hypothetical protein
MTKTSLRSIINKDLDVHNDSHIFNEDLYRFNHDVEDSNILVFHSLRLEIWLSVSSCLVQSRSLYSYRNTTFYVANSLVTCLRAIQNARYRVGPGCISPSDKLHSWLNKNFLRYLKDTFIITQLWSDGWYPQSIFPELGNNIISWSKDSDTWHWESYIN